jgi:DNA-binding NtrC family response regulator
MHTPSYVNKLLQDIFREGDLPAKILYFPPLEERKEDVNKLVRILNRFNKYALILVKEWGGA